MWDIDAKALGIDFPSNDFSMKEDVHSVHLFFRNEEIGVFSENATKEELESAAYYRWREET